MLTTTLFSTEEILCKPREWPYQAMGYCQQSPSQSIQIGCVALCHCVVDVLQRHGVRARSSDVTTVRVSMQHCGVITNIIVLTEPTSSNAVRCVLHYTHSHYFTL